jgi:hypothetical protein
VTVHSSFSTSDGVRIAYCVDDFTDPWKKAPVLVMLHAAMGSSRRFYSMVPGLARHFRVDARVAIIVLASWCVLPHKE